VGGRSLLDAALAAVAGAPVVVVGPHREVPPGVTVVREDPPGGGPAAAIAAAVPALPTGADDALVVVLAADLPAIDAGAVRRLCASVTATGAVLVDDRGRYQWLLGAWRHRALVRAVRRRPDWHGRSVRDLLGPLDPVAVTGCETATADVDTAEDWDRWRSSGPDR
jgi:molybdenum cofactor guanylyltransferase